MGKSRLHGLRLGWLSCLSPDAGFLEIPAILLTTLAITGTSFVIRHHKYEIRKEARNEAIDIAKALALVDRVANDHELSCKVCGPDRHEGLFSNGIINLAYHVLDKDRGIRFEITGQPGGLFFGEGSWEEMDGIKHERQNTLGNEFQGMEFVIRLNRE